MAGNPYLGITSGLPVTQAQPGKLAEQICGLLRNRLGGGSTIRFHGILRSQRQFLRELESRADRSLQATPSERNYLTISDAKFRMIDKGAALRSSTLVLIRNLCPSLE